MQGQRAFEGCFRGKPAELRRRRLVTAMANAGFTIGRYKVRSLMRQATLKPVWKRKFFHPTDSKHDLPVAANLLNRRFNPIAPNVAYVTDITYIRTGSGWLYLAELLPLPTYQWA